MAIASGDKLGPYELLESIGKGGMGEVYRAHDPRMGREVAIKVSAERFSDRFDREVRAIASLNHPNICTLYDVGPNYLVMELVEGPTLAERIGEGPLPLEEALAIARQIAAGLEAAHESGITHRDLKPGNVKIKQDGTAKVLDFGLAKVGPRTISGSNLEESPTVSLAATQTGVILGTAAYMAPEQARGKAVDKRADIWAFGVVLYEMVTGRKPFAGDDLTDTLATVVKVDPDFSAAPPELQRLLKRCLEKDPRKRLRDIGDVLDLIEPRADDQPISAEAKRRSSMLWALAAAVPTLALAVLAFVHFRELSPMPEMVRFDIPTVKGASGLLFLSPNGKHLVYTPRGPLGRDQLWLHSLESNESRALPGTEGVRAPFWSPDSRFVAYGVAEEGKLRKIDITGGGPPQTITDIGGAPLVGGAWTRDTNGNGVIIFGQLQLSSQLSAGLQRVSEVGGTPTPLTMLAEGEAFHVAPQFLPDGRHFLYLRYGVSDSRNRGIYIGSLDDKPDMQSRDRLAETDSIAWYAPGPDRNSGYFLFTREGSLMAQPFDARSLKLSGDPTPIAELSFRAGTPAAGPVFSASLNGVLAFSAGLGSGSVLKRLVWLDGEGKPGETVWETGEFNTLSLSPDGDRVAVERTVRGGRDIFLYDFAQRTSIQLTSAPGPNWIPVWSHDGSQIIFASGSGRGGVGVIGNSNLYRIATNGAGAVEELLKSPEPKFPQDWSRDGKYLLYTLLRENNNMDLWYLPMGGKEKPYITTDAYEGQARFSPDGHFVAYASGSLGSGPGDVYVRPFPDASPLLKVSEGGGSQPRWRRDGKELYYVSADSKMMAAEISTTPVLKVGARRELFPVPIFGGGRVMNIHRYDVTADGKKFIVNSPVSAAPASDDAASPPITVILNWQAMLKQ